MTNETYYRSDKIKEHGVELDEGIIKIPANKNDVLVAVASNGLTDNDKREIGIIVNSGKSHDEIFAQAKSLLGGQSSQWKEVKVYSVPQAKLEDCQMFPSRNVEQSRTVGGDVAVSL